MERSQTLQSELQLSIVIASWNNWNYLNVCLTSLPSGGLQEHEYEIIVVDNGSTDGTLNYLPERYPQVRLVANSVNQGHCIAINQGVRLSRGEYVLVLDADTVMWHGTLSQLLEFMRARPDVVIAAPKMLNADGTLQEAARSFPTALNGLFGRQSALTRLFPNNRFSRRYLRRDAIDVTAPFEVDFVSSACMIFPRSLPLRIGPWDEGFKGYWVDADWCKTARAAGKVFCVPALSVTHHVQYRSGKKKGAARIILFHTGAHRFYRKHFTSGLLDPGSLLACLALAARAALLLLADLFRRPDEPHKAAARPGSFPRTESAPPSRILGPDHD